MMNIKLEIKTRGYEIYTYFSAISKLSLLPRNEFVVFAHYRTGSTLLTDLLNSHPDVHCDDEIFLHYFQLRFKKMLSTYHYAMGRSLMAGTNAYGFNVKLYQLTKVLTRFHGEPEKFVLNLHEKGWKIIYLKRLNVFRQAISNLTAHNRKQWHYRMGNPYVTSKVDIDPEWLVQEMGRIEDNYLEECRVLKNVPHITLAYEPDLLRPDVHQETMDRLFDYLGLSQAPVRTTMVRASSDTLSESIANYDEVIKVVGKTRYSDYLEVCS